MRQWFMPTKHGKVKPPFSIPFGIHTNKDKSKERQCRQAQHEGHQQGEPRMIMGPEPVAAAQDGRTEQEDQGPLAHIPFADRTICQANKEKIQDDQGTDGVHEPYNLK